MKDSSAVVALHSMVPFNEILVQGQFWGTIILKKTQNCWRESKGGHEDGKGPAGEAE